MTIRFFAYSPEVDGILNCGVPQPIDDFRDTPDATMRRATLDFPTRPWNEEEPGCVVLAVQDDYTRGLTYARIRAAADAYRAIPAKVMQRAIDASGLTLTEVQLLHLEGPIAAIMAYRERTLAPLKGAMDHVVQARDILDGGIGVKP